MQINFAEFYQSRAGKIASKLIRNEIKLLWPRIPASEIIGIFGFPANYSEALPAECKQIKLIPSQLGSNAENFALVDERKLPLRDAELDKIVVIHALENSTLFDAVIPELWRVLKPNGKIILVIPNKKGFWKSKFGGYTLQKAEIKLVLLFNKFSLIKIRRAVFTPPFLPFEPLDKIFRILRPFCGVFIFEAEKLIYAPRGRTIKVVPSLLELITKRGLRPSAQ